MLPNIYQTHSLSRREAAALAFSLVAHQLVSSTKESLALAAANRDSQGKLSLSPDALKKNLVTYLNEFRLISDAIDILDAKIVNIGTRIFLSLWE